MVFQQISYKLIYIYRAKLIPLASSVCNATEVLSGSAVESLLVKRKGK